MFLLAVMKGHALRPDVMEQPASLPKIGAFGSKTFGTPAAMGVKKVS
jgi:hypothetical protein